MSEMDTREQIEELNKRIERLAVMLPSPMLTEAFQGLGASIDSLLKNMVARIDKLEERARAMTEKPEDQPEK